MSDDEIMRLFEGEIVGMLSSSPGVLPGDVIKVKGQSRSEILEAEVIMISPYHMVSRGKRVPGFYNVAVKIRRRIP